MENVNQSLNPKEWISRLLTASQLLERKNADYKSLLIYLKTDLDTARPVTSENLIETLCDDPKTAFKITQSRKALKGDKIYAYYRIGEYLRLLKASGMKAPQVKRELQKVTKQTGNRTYTVAMRVVQLMDALGPPHLRTFGLISPEVVYRIKKTEWDNLCDHATTLPSEQTILEETVELSSQELELQGGNDLLLQN